MSDSQADGHKDPTLKKPTCPYRACAKGWLGPIGHELEFIPCPHCQPPKESK